MHNEQPFEGNSYMPRPYGNFQVQPSMNPWVPGYDNQKERPRSVISPQNIHVASNNHSKSVEKYLSKSLFYPLFILFTVMVMQRRNKRENSINV